MERGKVKWFNPTKGYGFIEPDDGRRDIFVHIREVEHIGVSTLDENQAIGYRIENNKGKSSAVGFCRIC